MITVYRCAGYGPTNSGIETNHYAKTYFYKYTNIQFYNHLIRGKTILRKYLVNLGIHTSINIIFAAIF